MSSLTKLPPRAPFRSIPVKDAVYCKGCKTISNSRARRCGVCGDNALLRVAPILDPEPPPASAGQPARILLLPAVAA
jgi:hypothetical protein